MLFKENMYPAISPPEWPSACRSTAGPVMCVFAVFSRPMSIFSSFQHSQKGLLTSLDLDWARSIVQLNVKRWTLWTRRRGASPVYRRRVSSLPRFVDPANPGWCCVIGASEEMLTQRTVVMKITPNCRVEWPFYPVLLFLIIIISLCEQMEQFGCVQYDQLQSAIHTLRLIDAFCWVSFSFDFEFHIISCILFYAPSLEMTGLFLHNYNKCIFTYSLCQAADNV